MGFRKIQGIGQDPQPTTKEGDKKYEKFPWGDD